MLVHREDVEPNDGVVGAWLLADQDRMPPDGLPGRDVDLLGHEGENPFQELGEPTMPGICERQPILIMYR